MYKVKVYREGIAANPELYGKKKYDKLETYMLKTARLGVAQARALAPVKTGALVRAIKYEVKTGGSVGDLAVKVVSNPPGTKTYNIYQEFGTGLSGASGVIHHRAKSSLKDNTTALSYNVNVQGFGAQPFMHPTARMLARRMKTKVVYEEVFSE